ncbi:MAG TPA: hypothetical protein VK085_11285 [Pseudogracilibacillus sp.]|nr:hypothetical protein [Pseudogracilibacillus sp.]
MNNEVTFQESRIFKTTILLFVAGGIFSIIPEGDAIFLIINLALSLIAGVLFYTFWKRLKHHRKRYYSLLSFVMINVLAIYFAMPLLRIYFLTTTFWIGAIILLVMNILPYLYSREIAFGIQKPNKSKLGKIYTIYTILILFFGSIAYSNGLVNQYTDALTIAIITFFISILFFFISPIMLIKPKEMDKLVNE